jgi:hypothetical protein
LDGDGIFGETGSAAPNGDETGPTPSFYAYNLAPGTWPVSLQVIDSNGVPALAMANITIGIPDFMVLSSDAMIRWGAGGDPWITLSRGSLTLNGALHDVYPAAALWVENDASVHIAASQDLVVALHGASTGSLDNGAVLRGALVSFDTSRFDIGSGRIEDISSQADLEEIFQFRIQDGMITSSVAQADSRLGVAAYRPNPQMVVIETRLLGDLNADGRVSIADFIALASNFGRSHAVWAMGDTNYDRSITIADFITLASNFGQTYSPSAHNLNPPRPLLLYLRKPVVNPTHGFITAVTR